MKTEIFLGGVISALTDWDFPSLDVLGCDQWFTCLPLSPGKDEKETKADHKESCVLHRLSSVCLWSAKVLGMRGVCVSHLCIWEPVQTWKAAAWRRTFPSLLLLHFLHSSPDLLLLHKQFWFVFFLWKHSCHTPVVTSTTAFSYDLRQPGVKRPGQKLHQKFLF